MFNVDRYDPDAQKQKAKRKGDSKNASGRSKRVKPQHGSDSNNSNASESATPASSTTWHVIANEAIEPSSIVAAKSVLPEAFDDLDLLGEDLIAASLEGDKVAAENSTGGSDMAGSTGNAELPLWKNISNSEIQTALALSEMPIEHVAKGWKLVPFLLNNLRRDEYQHFFPIQALAIPDVIASERHAHTIRSSDICITAPTGSGKTLSYVLPILNALATHRDSDSASGSCSSMGDANGAPPSPPPQHQQQQRRRLRALVVLPSRDLATQVYNVFDRYMEGSTLKVGLAIGQSNFVAEQIALTVNVACNQIHMLQNRLSYYDPGNLELALQVHNSTPFASSELTDSSSQSYIPKDGWSNIDVLVCTPGRLVDHLDHTPGFTLQHLRFLVVDEADRLLSQSYHKWIDRVIDATNQASVAAWKNIIDGKLPPLQSTNTYLEPITWRRGGSSGDDTVDQINTNEANTASKVCQQIQLRKFLVSATLTRDPQKLASLRLINPKHFNVHQITTRGEANSNKYSMPATLEEYVVECTAEQKPMVLLSLLVDRINLVTTEDQRKRMTVIFTSSLDSTHRLARLLQLLWGTLHHGSDLVGEFSSASNQQERAELMKRCNDPNHNLSIIVCSDGMSRGMDLDFVDTVINYDIPTLAKTYVHRCGRTARASRSGTAITLVKGGQNSLFYRMRNLIQESQRVQTMLVNKNVISNALHVYRLCIKALREVLGAEANGEIGHRESISSYLPDSKER